MCILQAKRGNGIIKSYLINLKEGKKEEKNIEYMGQMKHK